MYYTGIGVFNFDGKDYGYGEELPGSVPKDTIASMLAKGKVSESAPAVGSTGAEDTRLGALQDQVTALTVERDALKEEVEKAWGWKERMTEDLAAAKEEVKRLTEELAAAKADVEALTKAMTEATPPTVPGAGPDAGKAGKK